MGAIQSMDASWMGSASTMAPWIDTPCMSGDGTVENVGIRMSGSFQCPECCQKFENESSMNLHYKFMHAHGCRQEEIELTKLHQEEEKPMQVAEAPMQVDDEQEEEVVCRYCFCGEEDGELISPCACIGSQKYCHLSCLRQWQKMVLVSQPTDPALQKNDSRHHICNVCNSQYTCAPPTRHDLMVSCVGEEVAELISEGSIFGSQNVYLNGLTQNVERQLTQQFPSMPSEMITREVRHSLHRFEGVYLITKVEEDNGMHEISIINQVMLNQFRERLDDSLSLKVEGNELRLVAAGSLAGVPEEELRRKLAALQAPVNLTLAAKEAPTSGDDRVAAVNLTHRMEPVSQLQVDQAMTQACEKYYGARRVKLTHYGGGPVEAHKISMCLVPGGDGRGWTLEKDLSKAIELAYSRAVKRYATQGKIAGGQTVRLTGLQGAAHLNGELGLALQFNEGSGRWLVRLGNGETKQVKVANLEPLEGGTGRVYVFWGACCWSRTQLLGEIAKGQWGVCRASVQDFASPEGKRKQGLDGRLTFAPVTEMTEDFMRDASRQTIPTDESAELPICTEGGISNH